MTSPPGGASLRTSRVIHAAMLASLVIYAVVVHVLRGAAGWRPALPPEPLALIRPILYALATALTATVFALRGRWFSTRRGALPPSETSPPWRGQSPRSERFGLGRTNRRSAWA